MGGLTDAIMIDKKQEFCSEVLCGNYMGSWLEYAISCIFLSCLLCLSPLLRDVQLCGLRASQTRSSSAMESLALCSLALIVLMTKPAVPRPLTTPP